VTVVISSTTAGSIASNKIGVTGFEPATLLQKSLENEVNPRLGSAESGAAGAPFKRELAQIAAAWPNLPPLIRAGIVAIVKAASEAEK
jgi:hypothetical protein